MTSDYCKVNTCIFTFFVICSALNLYALFHYEQLAKTKKDYCYNNLDKGLCNINSLNSTAEIICDNGNCWNKTHYTCIYYGEFTTIEKNTYFKYYEEKTKYPQDCVVSDEVFDCIYNNNKDKLYFDRKTTGCNFQYRWYAGFSGVEFAIMVITYGMHDCAHDSYYRKIGVIEY